MNATKAAHYKTATTKTALSNKRKTIPAGTIFSVRVASEIDIGVAPTDDNLFFVCSRKGFPKLTIPESFLTDFCL